MKKPQPTMWKFTQVSQDQNKSSEVTVFLSPDASWDEIMPHFASFLEGAGYTGVYNKLEVMGAFDLMKIFNKEYYDPFSAYEENSRDDE